MQRYLDAWERLVQAHFSSQEWSIFVSRERLTDREKELFHCLLCAMIKPNSTMPYEMVDAITGWALEEIGRANVYQETMDRPRFHQLQAEASGLARMLAYNLDWSRLVEPALEVPDYDDLGLDPEGEDQSTLAPPPEPTQPVMEPRPTLPVPEGFAQELLEAHDALQASPLPLFADDEVPTARRPNLAVTMATYMDKVADAPAAEDGPEVSFVYGFEDEDAEEPDR